MRCDCGDGKGRAGGSTAEFGVLSQSMYGNYNAHSSSSSSLSSIFLLLSRTRTSSGVVDAVPVTLSDCEAAVSAVASIVDARRCQDDGARRPTESKITARQSLAPPVYKDINLFPIAMKTLLTSLLVVVCSLSSSAADQTKPVPISNGNTFAGWDGDSNSTWRIEDGAFVGGSLKTTVPRNEFLATTRSFTNFVLRVKFKLTGTEGFINGGVQIRSVRTTNPPNEMSGYQVDMGDPEWWGCIYDESRRNKVLAKSAIDEVNKVLKRNDWNEYTIRCEGKRIRAYINGQQTVDYTEPEDSIPQFVKIGLQVHGGGKSEAWYKDITIEELP